MLKWIGMLFIIFAGTMAGYYKASQYSKRPRQIREIIQALSRLETEIMYGFTPLPEALVATSRQLSGPVRAMFAAAGQELAQIDSSTTWEVWQQAVEQHWRFTALGPSELEVMKQLGHTLGISDRGDQVNHIKLSISQLQGEEQLAREEQKRYEKMSRSLGFLTALLIVIVMY
ncbi:MAG: stage III sporulation protein AB [Paenibacillus sp. RIFOXYA1_FULL_44_5]|nr:MAG: stage III sporulation protein AB [Paenibacillus sp. RIFOXYA1_FULL_44_5]